MTSTLPRSQALWTRLLVTLAVIVVYRLGVWIPLPTIDPERLQQLWQQLGQLSWWQALGGAIERLSVFALGLIPLPERGDLLQFDRVPVFQAAHALSLSRANFFVVVLGAHPAGQLTASCRDELLHSHSRADVMDAVGGPSCERPRAHGWGLGAHLAGQSDQPIRYWKRLGDPDRRENSIRLATLHCVILFRSPNGFVGMGAWGARALCADCSREPVGLCKQSSRGGSHESTDAALLGGGDHPAGAGELAACPGFWACERSRKSRAGLANMAPDSCGQLCSGQLGIYSELRRARAAPHVLLQKRDLPSPSRAHPLCLGRGALS
jgi:hypothetical protein